MARTDDADFAAFAVASGPASAGRRTSSAATGTAPPTSPRRPWSACTSRGRGSTDHGLRLRAAHRRTDRHRPGRKRSSREAPTLALVDGPVADFTGQLVDRALLMAALADLPARQRACVVLRYYDDLSVESVAEALGCRTGTVKSQTARGLEALRTAYARHGQARRHAPR